MANIEQTNETQEQQAPQTEVPAIEQQFSDTPEQVNDSFDALIGTLDPKGTLVEEETNMIEQGLPAQPTTPPPTPLETPPDNDQVRFEYWQSESAKRDNKIEQLQETINNLSKTQTPEPKKESAPVKEEFPPPPGKPETPIGYNREEAYADPNSASAQYDSKVEQWREDMVTYGNLQNQYQIAQMQEVYNKKIDDLQKVNLQRQNHDNEQRQVQKVRSYVASNYDLGDNLDNFVQEMSNPKSINMNDLVGYYKYKHGIAGATPNANAQPSSQFNQIKRAQSVPTPMGVKTGQGHQGTSPTDSFMDSIIKGEGRDDIL